MNIFDKFFPTDDHSGHSHEASPRWSNVVQAFSTYAQQRGDVLISPSTKKMENFIRSNNPEAIRISGDRDFDIYVISKDAMAYIRLSHMSDYTVY